MAGRHRAQTGTIQIIKTAVLKASECKRDHVTEMLKSDMKFPVVRKMPLAAKKLRATYTAKRPMTFVR
jgi:large subunit ribosomal protein L18Ae